MMINENKGVTIEFNILFEKLIEVYPTLDRTEVSEFISRKTGHLNKSDYNFFKKLMFNELECLINKFIPSYRWNGRFQNPITWKDIVQRCKYLAEMGGEYK